MSCSVTQVVIALLCSNETYRSFNRWGFAVAEAINSLKMRLNDLLQSLYFCCSSTPTLLTPSVPIGLLYSPQFSWKNRRLDSLMPQIHTVARKHLVWQYEKSRAGSSWCFGLALSHGLVLHLGLTSLHFPLGQNCPRKFLWLWLCYVENRMLLLSHSSY